MPEVRLSADILVVKAMPNTKSFFAARLTFMPNVERGIAAAGCGPSVVMEISPTESGVRNSDDDIALVDDLRHRE